MSYLPPHEVREEAKLNSMISAIEAGKELPPILVFLDQAFSGSHRIAAWDALDMEHDAVELDNDEYVQIMQHLGLDPMYDSITEFEDFLEAAQELGFAANAK